VIGEGEGLVGESYYLTTIGYNEEDSEKRGDLLLPRFFVFRALIIKNNKRVFVGRIE